MMLDLKEKIGYLKKIQVWYFYHSVVLFLKNLSEESRPLFGGAASRMFWTRQKERVPNRTPARYERYQLYCVYSAFISE